MTKDISFPLLLFSQWDRAGCDQQRLVTCHVLGASPRHRHVGRSPDTQVRQEQGRAWSADCEGAHTSPGQAGVQVVSPAGGRHLPTSPVTGPPPEGPGGHGEQDVQRGEDGGGRVERTESRSGLERSISEQVWRLQRDRE